MEKQHRHNIAYTFWCALLVMLCYGSSLSLPFLADDFFQFPFVDQHTLVQIWLTSEGLYYFRPLSFTIWKLFQLVLGGNEPTILHAINLLVFWIGGLLVGLLAGRLWSGSLGESNMPPGSSQLSVSWRHRFVAATLFLLFPFSYEAVPWIAALMHPLVTVLALLAVISYVNLRRSGRAIWILPTFLFVFLAPFAHEIGLVTVPLLVAIELTCRGLVEISRKRVIVLVVLIIPTIFWWLIWRQSPTAIGTGGLHINHFRQLALNMLYAAQGVAYPFSWIGVPLSRWTGSSQIFISATLSITAISLAAWVQWRTRASRLALLPWLWIIITSAPAILFLSFPYFSAAPRVLMLPSVGIAWLWTDVGFRLPSLFPATRVPRRVSELLVAALLLPLIVQNLASVRRQIEIFTMGGRLIDSVVEETRQASQVGLSTIFINLPVWLAPAENSYPIGEEGAMLMPAIDNLEALVSVHTGQSAAIKAAVYHDIRAQVPYHSGLLGNGPNWDDLSARPAAVFVSQYGLDVIQIQKVGQIAIPEPNTQPIAIFGNSILLLEAQADAGEEAIETRLVWQVDNEVPSGITVFVHAVDEIGQLIAQRDGDPLGGTFPFPIWEKGTVASDIRTIVTDHRNLSLHIGLYDRVSGERLSAYTLDGTELGKFVTVPIGLREE